MSAPPPRPSLKNIAQETGVSVSLVSKVLNNRLGNTGVTEELAEKIRKAAKDLGYRKNASAESLRTGRHDSIGVMLHRHGEAGSPLIENLVLGISEIARVNRQKLILNFFERDDEFIEMSKSAHRGYMDGLILGGMIHPALKSLVLNLQTEGLPVITIFEKEMDSTIYNVGMDQSLVTEISTRHLLEQGCQSIGLIDVHSDRIKGYRRALKEADIQIQDHWIYPAAQYTFSYQAGEAAVKYWYESQKMPEGIVGESDAQAMGAINTLKELGLRVPEDVKVTGIDNSPFCEYARPTITSVSQQNQFRGQKAMKAILKLATGKTPNESSIEPVLIPRASSRL